MGVVNSGIHRRTISSSYPHSIYTQVVNRHSSHEYMVFQGKIDHPMMSCNGNHSGRFSRDLDIRVKMCKANSNLARPADSQKESRLGHAMEILDICIHNDGLFHPRSLGSWGAKLNTLVGGFWVMEVCEKIFR